MSQPPYPLHESVRDLLHPEYVAFYNSHIKDLQQVHYQPVGASRASGVLIPGAGPLIPVGETRDVAIKRKESDGPDVQVRCFWPDAAENEPENDAGWPVMLYFHGGGWVLGNLDTENAVCTNVCSRARCVVVTVGYRLGPEIPFPAAVHDAWEALLWLQSGDRSLLNIDTSRIAVAGSSAGGNLAAIIAHRSIARSMPALKLQILVVPVMDNTADTTNNATYRDYEHGPALPAARADHAR
ncbi:uncharacterized protein GIQ15_01473 [Arthroderma uncinatum]|uniref:uncharacterized protein n=1 Tax=Arthroderma uncinatum TaxID=74035 RepID=UPI00144A8671|nr:uncharacterized protein GIQ15_01473 [Arthroderma uncinatum]KAF3491956.1 hypothetical protein GIQ15_01473 [Arthroderma uncinatum]